MSKEEITLDDYILTNIDIKSGYFTIRLKDEKEYIVYGKHETEKIGSKIIYYIIKDNQEVPLDCQVKKVYLQNVREYQVSGI